MSKRTASRPASVRSGVRLRRAHISQFRDGWWMGAFKPSMLPTSTFEVAYKRHPQGQRWPTHYQRLAWEYNLLIRGRLRIGHQLFRAGDIFCVPPLVVVKPSFLTDCEVMVVKAPSIPGDKVVCT